MTEKNADMVEEHGDSSEEVSDEDDQLLDDDTVEKMGNLNFDFEALPPDDSDVNQLVNLLTQIFLRADLDLEDMAKAVVEQSPLGCVFKTAEDCADEDDDEDPVIYGVSSVIPISPEKNFRMAEYLKNKASAAVQDAVKLVQSIFGSDSADKIGFVINERMLHFPAEISGPALSSLKDDIAKKPYTKFVIISKLRVPRDTTTSSNAKGNNSDNSKDIRFDNPEESTIYKEWNVPFFQYPVHSDVEKDSKFHILRVGDAVYEPYRRLCILDREQFIGFCTKVASMY